MWPPSLLRALDIHPGSLVAIVGAGGKTSVLLSLARSLRADDRSILLTTTTKTWQPAGIPLLLQPDDPEEGSAVAAALESSCEVVLADHRTSDGKLSGVLPETLCRLRERLSGVTILCEADGAAGLPLKAHAPHEPVVPACATHLIVVGGLAATGSPARSAAHRAEIFCDRLGIDGDEPIQPAHVAYALGKGAEYAPDGARVLLVLNQADSDDRMAAAEVAAKDLLVACPGATIVTARHGEPGSLLSTI